MDPLPIALALVAVLLTVAFYLLKGRGGGAAASPPAAKAAEAKAESFPNGPLVIVWGSQTGTAEAFGNMLAREARQRGFKAKSVDMEDYEPDELREEDAPVVFLMATHGEGEPTDNALAFYKYLNEPEREADELASLRFAAFALGNTQYEQFCYMGKWVDEKCAALGATRVYELGLGDDDDDLEGDFERWREGLWEALCPGGADVTTAPAPQFESKMLDGGKPPATLSFFASSLPKQRLFECAVAVNRELAQQPERGSVRHIELLVGGGGGGGGSGGGNGGGAGAGKAPLKYKTADDLAVCCDNGAALARRVAKRLGLRPEQRFALRARTPGGGAPPLPTPCSVEQALRYHVDLRAAPSKAALLMLAEACARPSEAARLRSLALPDGKAAYAEYIARDGRGLAELLAEFGSCAPGWAALLELAPKLAPRYYTIASSPAHDAATVSLTVKVLREPMKGCDAASGRVKEGVCSTQLGALAAGGTAHVFVRSSGFALPTDDAAPVVMVGPGTGIAPFRAFLQELQAARGEGGKGGTPRAGHVRLYFGCRREAEDYLYKDELAAYLKAGTLSSLRLAFSRETAAKVYVQTRVAEDGAELVEMLQRGGHVYICGGTAMGRDVVAAVQEAVRVHAGLPAEAAEAYIKAMQAQGRLVQELWS